jgi:tetratricopeptide (TPR) repeat protein
MGGTGQGGPAAGGREDAVSWQAAWSTGNATASGGGTAVSGVYNDNSTTVLPAEVSRAAAETAAPAGLDSFPVHTGPFVGRAGDLERLDAALAGPGAALVRAVHGLGGVGKSTLAAHWAATRPHGHRPVRWITADSPASVQQGLVSLATALQPALSKVLTVDALAEFAVQWLATHTGWLVVLDNVNDPADIAPLVTRAPGGRFLITSRLANPWTDPASLIRLDVLEPAESLELLTRIVTARHTARDLSGAGELCEELGHLPLAVEQAAAYIAETGITPRAYLDLLARYPTDMFRDGETGRTPERTIARIWRITLDRLSSVPLTGELLRVLAWYAPADIPRTLLTPLGKPPALNKAIGRLAAHNMLTTAPATGALGLHRLLQTVARTPDPDDPHRTPSLIHHAHRQATDALREALPASFDSPADWPAWRTLLPHIDALTDRTHPDNDTTATTALLSRAGCYLDNQGQTIRAVRHLQRAHTTAELLLGPDHPDTLRSRNNLASAHDSAGDLGLAIPLYEQNLTDRARVLGADHPETLLSRNNLAYAYNSAGDLSRAIPLHEQNLADSIRVLGADHPDTLLSRNNLAHAYSAGDLDRAIPLFEQNLTDSIRVLGEQHPLTVAIRKNLTAALTERDNRAGES